ncbi:MAG: hypothetical protein IT537_30545 [Hyphomicrobiales bacterium]|nr:hypothetical protein [Hyphomicrobiales bacterium]
MFGRSKSNGGNGAKTLEREVAALRDRRGTLVSALSAAEIAANAAHTARREALLGGDLDSGEHDARCRACADRSAAISDAIDQLDQTIGETEQRLAAERDKIERAAEVVLRRGQADALARAITAYEAAALAVADATRPLQPSLSAVGVADLVVTASAALRDHARGVLADLRSYTERVEAGTEVVWGRSRPQPPPPPPAPLGPPSGIMSSSPVDIDRGGDIPHIVVA